MNIEFIMYAKVMFFAECRKLSVCITNRKPDKMLILL